MNRKTFIHILWAGLSVGAVAAFAQSYDLSWYTIEGGGAMRSTGGSFELSGTIGQPDAGAMTGGAFELTGGFWFEIPLGDCQDDGDVDLFDYDLFPSCLTGPAGAVAVECRCFDLNASGTIDLADFADMAIGFTRR